MVHILWRKERRRTVPSPSAVFRFLRAFHDEEEEKKRQPHTAFIPAPNEALEGLRKVNRDLAAFLQSRAPQTGATLDQDATLVEAQKKDALYSYQGDKAYQPLTTYWAEQDAVVDSEFRDGNVPAGHESRRVGRRNPWVCAARGGKRLPARSGRAARQNALRALGRGPSFLLAVAEGTAEDTDPGPRTAMICVNPSPHSSFEATQPSRQGRPRLPSGQSPMKTTPEAQMSPQSPDLYR